MNGMLAEVLFRGMSFAQMAIAVVICAGVIALMFIALRKLNVAIPDWVIQAFWVCVVCVVIIFAIRFVSGL